MHSELKEYLSLASLMLSLSTLSCMVQLDTNSIYDTFCSDLICLTQRTALLALALFDAGSSDDHAVVCRFSISLR